ncbi:hypothetical protein BDF14DRAFT_1996808 [Spinellus fusiger]|nr:hypothetical protein BDF14DRAFT_1996808 [Spinellus fusiger]
MDRSLIEYDQSLEKLERQREQLESIMKRMGKEWEKSGAGIGWLGSLPPEAHTETSPPPKLQAAVQPPLVTLLNNGHGSSHEHLNSLLTPNEVPPLPPPTQMASSDFAQCTYSSPASCSLLLPFTTPEKVKVMYSDITNKDSLPTF